MELIGEYDEIEIPPVKPYVVRLARDTAFALEHGSDDLPCKPRISASGVPGSALYMAA
jgi:hypothetical protein